MVDLNKLKKLQNAARKKVKTVGEVATGGKRIYGYTVPPEGGKGNNIARVIFIPPYLGDEDDRITFYGGDDTPILVPYKTVSYRNDYEQFAMFRVRHDEYCPIQKWLWTKFKAMQKEDLEMPRAFLPKLSYLSLVYIVKDEKKPDFNGTFNIIRLSKTLGEEIGNIFADDENENFPFGVIDVGAFDISYKMKNDTFGDYSVNFRDKPFNVIEDRDPDEVFDEIRRVVEEYEFDKTANETFDNYDEVVSRFAKHVGEEEWLRYGGDPSYLEGNLLKAAGGENAAPATPAEKLKKKVVKNNDLDDELPFDDEPVEKAKPEPKKSLAEELDDDIPWDDDDF